jgi:hypothetical protein
MTARLKRGGFRSRYRLRKQTVEPVFGQIKAARGFTRFSLRGLAKAASEWSLVCTGPQPAEARSRNDLSSPAAADPLR